MRKTFKKEIGITLIALIVTIIVLLILAGVSINAMVGKNGVISKSKKAETDTIESKEAEFVELAYSSIFLESATEGMTEDEQKQAVEDELKRLAGDKAATVKNNGDRTLTVKFTETGNEYKIELDNLDYTTDELGWTAILKAANANPESYKHSEQLQSKYIGIGTDGKPVNMDLWNPTKNSENSYALGIENYNYSYSDAYLGTYIDGRIQGEIPQYIYDEETKKFLPVTEMFATFSSASELTVAPKIPDTVTSLDYTFHITKITEAPEIPSGMISMRATFANCSNLEKACTIPVNVKYMMGHLDGQDWGTFSGCNKLTGELIINANPIEYKNCLQYAATYSGCELLISGESEMLEEILATKSSTSNISIK